MGVLILALLAFAAVSSSCELFGADGPTYLGVDWEGGTLTYDWDLPYPFNDSTSWDAQTYYEIEPSTYYFQYDLPTYSFSSTWYSLTIEAEAGSFPFQEGAETAFALLLMSTGPELYSGNQVAAAKNIEPDGSWTATASIGGKTATLSHIVDDDKVYAISHSMNSKTK
ncbi:MAG: hypothetical protein CVV47_08480 [Spirochaetae bacterium HGW-Spirochaetae-3]|jgi:hypothetical protein|nr:MAG: hypothetical protein CVV47_08480 [Spirochaetae bacterium HGW-Spirochaetae-3]